MAAEGQIDVDAEDEIIGRIPIYYSNALSPHIHLHQFQLTDRPLTVPPSAIATGDRIQARTKQDANRYEIHVPKDRRPQVWSAELGEDFAQARAEEDAEERRGQRNAAAETSSQSSSKGKMKENGATAPSGSLSHTRLVSERVPHTGAYVLGFMEEGALYLHPISETHRFNPSLAYLDNVAKTQLQMRRNPEIASDDEQIGEAGSSQPKPKKDKPAPREISVTAARRGEMDGEYHGLSSLRREMITKRRSEREEEWEDLTFNDTDSQAAADTLDQMLSHSRQPLVIETRLDDLLRATYDPAPE